MSVIDIAAAEIGYLEKASAAKLDSKTANAGHGNFTKYWRDIFPSYQGQPWCDCFVSWCFLKAYGKAGADALLCGGLMSFYTPTSANLFKAAGKWAADPRPGAQIFFKNSTRIYHTGIVESFTSDTVTTIEGNTDTGAGVVANGGGVWRKIYKRNDSRIAGYGITGGDMIYTTAAKFISAARAVYLAAHNGGYTYGDSKSTPPTADHVISCDRLIAKACYDLGWTAQPPGGITVLNMESYLTRWGFKKITTSAALKKGDIVLMKQNGQAAPSAAWHTFVLTAYDAKTQVCSKYDMGSNARIRSAQPFINVPLNEWAGAKTFYCGFRPPEADMGYYKIFTAEFKNGSKGSHVKLAQLILRGRGYKGKDGKLLLRDGIAGANTIYALKRFQTKHKLSPTGICDKQTWNKLTGRKVTG